MESRRELKKRADAAEQLADERLALLTDFENSHSWRMTAPLRKAKARMRGSAPADNGAAPAAPVETPAPEPSFTPEPTDSHDLWQRPWRDSDDPPENVTSIPAMITPEERRLLHWLGRDYYSGAGRILDAGCYLGGSTTALASGLAARPERPTDRPIATYDLFVLDFSMLIDLPADTDLDEGESFRGVFDDNVEPYADLVEVRAGNVLDIGWSGEPIEVAFLDLLKTWPVDDYVTREFFGHFIPGRTILVQQDFVHEFAPWIHVTMGMLAPYFELLDAFDWCSATYLLQEPIPRDVLETRTRKDLTSKQIIEYMDRAIAPMSGDARGTLEIAKAVLLLLVEGPDAMTRQLDLVDERYGHSERIERSIELALGWGMIMGYRELRLRGKR
jgi:hypothetical protein